MGGASARTSGAPRGWPVTICCVLKKQSEDLVTVRSAVMILQCEGSSGSHSEPRQCDRERGFARRIGFNTQILRDGPWD